ncbi:hypothetical protein [Chthonobacter albigriseus]|uniref:hypothetical protein n=1 Tax=Chthonobacter albigriseus TaxID=1683161 RepID=UPI0015EF2B67|nr:hypothetical protein [Chthonobacter albigriseus]
MSNPTPTTRTARSSGELTPAEVEGVLAAHRRILEALVAIAVKARGPGLLDDLADHLGTEDHQEDPGVEPDAAFATERIADAEVKRLLRAVRDGLSTAGGGDTGASPSSLA